MRKTLALLLILPLGLSACMQDPASRGLAGAALGAAVADATEGNLVNGAVIGGLAGMASCGVQVGLPPCY